MSWLKVLKNVNELTNLKLNLKQSITRFKKKRRGFCSDVKEDCKKDGTIIKRM